MEIRENTDRLLAQVRVSRRMYQRIMEGKEMRRRRKFVLRKAASRLWDTRPVSIISIISDNSTWRRQELLR